jgi:clan AA aspartic protease (TIGR02281 family)
MFKHACFGLTVAALALGALSACDAAPASPSPSAGIPMKKDGGVYVVPVSVNGLITIDCIVDSGASDVNFPTDVFRKLLQAGSIKESDFAGTREYTLADGSTERGRTFRIKSLKVGNIVVTDVVASVGGDGSNALLGQSFLGRFASWSLDNSHHALVLVGTPSAAPAMAGHGSVAIHGPTPVDGPPSVANTGERVVEPLHESIGAQTSGRVSGRNDDSVPTPPSRDATDDRLTAQHSQ